MSQEVWSAVDQYVTQLLIPGDRTLEAALRASSEAGLPSIQVSPPQGKLLHLLARSMHARYILEIGTLGGYSTIWMARALPAGGVLLTLETDAKHAEVARGNIARAGLAGVVEQRLGPALATLPKIAAENREPFDLIFIDANKSTMAEYFDWALKLSRPGTMIIADNVVRDGQVIDAASQDADVQGVRRFNERMAAERRVSATEIQTVGSKGYDGFALALVLADLPQSSPNLGRGSVEIRRLHSSFRRRAASRTVHADATGDLMPIYPLLLHHDPTDWKTMSPKEMHEAIPRFVAGRQKLDSQKLLVRGAKQRDDGDRFLERQLSQCTPLPVEALPVACPDPLLGL